MTTELNYKMDNNTERVFDVVVVGAGIAGMTAAIYARRAHKSVLVLDEKGHGGQIIQTFWIANWPGEDNISGTDLTDKIYHQANNLAVKFEYASVDKIEKDGEIWKLKEEGDSDTDCYRGRVVILAVGSVEKQMGIAREEEFISRGVSYCATCDGGFFHDTAVAVVGGGNTALYEALYLADIASEVYIVHRRDKFRGDKVLVEKLEKKKNVKYVMDSVPVEILGEEKVTGLVVEGVEGRKELPVNGIFVAIGRRPDTQRFADLVKLDKEGYIVADENCHTSCEGIFVAGDARTKPLRQLVTAAADGAVAATEAVKWLR